MQDCLSARATGIRLTPASFAARNSFAIFSIAPVMPTSAGPPFGGLYLKPPSSGGLCDGVMTKPSPNPALRPRLYVTIACETTDVGVLTRYASIIVVAPFAPSTSRERVH